MNCVRNDNGYITIEYNENSHLGIAHKIRQSLLSIGPSKYIKLIDLAHTTYYNRYLYERWNEMFSEIQRILGIKFPIHNDIEIIEILIEILKSNKERK